MIHAWLYDRQPPVIRSVLDDYNKLTITILFSVNLNILKNGLRIIGIGAELGREMSLLLA